MILDNHVYKEQNYVFMYHNKKFKKQNIDEVSISVDGCYRLVTNNENIGLLNESFVNLIEENKSEDIFEITKKVKKLFSELDEEEFNITVESDEYKNIARYKNGKLIECIISYRVWDDYLTVIDDFRGTEIKFNQRNLHSKNLESTQAVLTQISNHLNKIIELRSLNTSTLKEKDKPKTYVKQ